MIAPVDAMNSILSELHTLAGQAARPAGLSAELAPTASGGAAGASFSTVLRNALTRLDSTVANADQLAKASAAGDRDIALSDVMVSMAQANLAMQMAANVRDKVTAAYTNIMNMPV